MAEKILEIQEVDYSYRADRTAHEHLALQHISFAIHPGEIVAFLGPSGCGKSTLMRIACGLLNPYRGQVLWRDKVVSGPLMEVGVVFQQFALYPWLTISQNIEQVLIPRGLNPAQRKQRVSEVITLIGLDGFEEAYPRELSGGMKQRVSIARALAIHPELLLLDEPFSQVDALTAETLRTEVVNLWRDRERYPQSIIFVSHDIHEVVSMASRIMVMGDKPGHIQKVIDNPLAYPRDPRSTSFQMMVEKLHDIITGLYLPEEQAPTIATIVSSWSGAFSMVPLPLVEVRDVIGILEAVSARGGNVPLFRLNDEIDTTFTSILLATKGAELLGFLTTPEDHLIMTDIGKEFMLASKKMQKQIFKNRFVQLNLFKRLKDMLERSPEGRFPRQIFLEELAIHCPLEDPKKLFRILINWGKYAELWSYQAAISSVVLVGREPVPVLDLEEEANP
ncbi:MAG: ATP-binding cassette domain-containing protein [Deltaproteobacteria bacterium]|nr:MAG: ATP-binding cassette domain-containing protein [Deltaproteobacteria bacterium]